MVDSPQHRVLVPLDVLGGSGVPTTIVDAFASASVVLLGYHQVPDQTPTEQARTQYETRARRELTEQRSVFEAAGCDVESRLVFTHNRFTTFERIAVDLDCDAVLLLNPAPVLERFLVAIRGDVTLDYIARLVSTILIDTDIDVTLFHVATKEKRREAAEELLATARAAFEAHGTDRDRITCTVVVDDSPTDAIVAAAADHDLVVAGESRPSIRRYIFRDRAERIAKRTIDPVLVIRGEYLEDDETDEASHV